MDFRQDGNLTAVFLDSAAKDKWDGVTLETFLNKTIRFRGKVTLYNGRKQVEISVPSDLEIVTP
jgi:DNA/RNA endonuclease YhcR with UshA esterase domain